jgi:hypothetical protein
MKWILGVTAIAVTLGLAATMTVPAQTITPDETTLSLFPPETQGIASVDVAGLRGASLFNDLILQRMPQPQGLSEFAQATGFNVEQDVDHVTVGRIGTNEVLAIVQARYDPFKVTQFVQDKADHITTETYLGRVIYEPSVPPQGKDFSGGVAFIGNQIVAGSLPAVKEAIDRMAAAAPSVVQNTDLMNQIRTIGAGNQIWAAGTFDLAMLGNRVPMPGNVGNLAQSLKSGTYQMRIDQDLHVKANGSFSSADMAKATTDMLRGLVAMAKLQVSQDDNFGHLLDGLDIENAGVNLTVSFNASGDLLKQIPMPTMKPKQGMGH